MRQLLVAVLPDGRRPMEKDCVITGMDRAGIQAAMTSLEAEYGDDCRFLVHECNPGQKCRETPITLEDVAIEAPEPEAVNRTPPPVKRKPAKRKR